MQLHGLEITIPFSRRVMVPFWHLSQVQLLHHPRCMLGQLLLCGSEDGDSWEDDLLNWMPSTVISL